MIEVKHVDSTKNEIGFISNEENIDSQLAELRNVENTPEFDKAIREHFQLPAPGISDRTLRYYDAADGKLLKQVSASERDPNIEFRPILIFRLDSLYA